MKRNRKGPGAPAYYAKIARAGLKRPLNRHQMAALMDRPVLSFSPIIVARNVCRRHGLRLAPVKRYSFRGQPRKLTGYRFEESRRGA